MLLPLYFVVAVCYRLFAGRFKCFLHVFFLSVHVLAACYQLLSRRFTCFLSYFNF